MDRQYEEGQVGAIQEIRALLRPLRGVLFWQNRIKNKVETRRWMLKSQGQKFASSYQSLFCSDISKLNSLCWPCRTSNVCNNGVRHSCENEMWLSGSFKLFVKWCVHHLPMFLLDAIPLFLAVGLFICYWPSVCLSGILNLLILYLCREKGIWWWLYMYLNSGCVYTDKQKLLFFGTHRLTFYNYEHLVDGSAKWKMN